MKRDFTKRPNRMTFRFEPDASYGTGSNSGPQRVIGTVGFPTFGTGEKSPDMKVPLPRNPVTGFGNSRPITAEDGAGGAWDGWREPASQVCKPNGKGYKK